MAGSTGHIGEWACGCAVHVRRWGGTHGPYCEYGRFNGAYARRHNVTRAVPFIGDNTKGKQRFKLENVSSGINTRSEQVRRAN